MSANGQGSRRARLRTIEVVEYPWHEGPAGALQELVGDVPFGADVPLPATTDLAEDVAALDV